MAKPKSFFVLIVEDNPGDLCLIREYLMESVDCEFKTSMAGTLAAAIQHLSTQKTDVVLLDLSLPDSQGLGTFSKIYKQFPSLPFIILSGLEDKDIAITAMQQGAQDYLSKNHILPDLLERTICYSIERKKAADELRLSEEKFEKAFALVPAGIIITRLRDGKILMANDEIARLSLYSKEELHSSTTIDINIWTDLKQRDELIALLHKEKSFRNIDVIFKDRNNKSRTCRSSAIIAMFDNEPCAISSFVDIEGRVVAEKALNKSELKFRQLVETTTDIIWETNIKGLYTYVNPKSENVLGYKSDEVIGHTPFEFMPPDEAIKIKKISDEIIASKKPFAGLVNINLHKDGHQVVLETSGKPVFDEKENLLGYRGIDRDISERMKAEEALKENNSRLELAMQSANMAWWEMEISNGNVIFDKRKSEMLGYPDEKFKHYRDFMALVHPEDADKAMKAMQRHIDGFAGTYEIEYRILTQSGEYKWFYDIGAVIKKDSKGIPLRVTGLVLDISKRKLAEEAVKQKMEELEHFNNIMVGRELKMIELKKEVNELLERIGEEKKYKIVTEEE